MADVLITEQITGEPIDELGRSFDVRCAPELWRDNDALREALSECRAVIVRNQTKLTADVLDAALRLAVIGRAGAGLDNIDVDAASERGVVVCYTPEQNAVSVAELALGMMLSLARRIHAADVDTKAGHWNRLAFTGTELYGKTLGVVGLGRIGFLLAMRARAMGMRVIAHDRFVSKDSPLVLESRAELVDLNELLGASDYVSCHLPANEQTRGFFGAEHFERMKPTAHFLNLARGEVVDEPALVDALKRGTIAGAGLDVRAAEPPERSALNGMNNVVLTPHIGAFTTEAQQRVVASVCSDISAVLRGEAAMNFHNFPRPTESRTVGG